MSPVICYIVLPLFLLPIVCVGDIPGTTAGTRLEFDTGRGKYKYKYDFALDFKTTNGNGTVFYVAGSQHTHYVALVIVSGKVRYLFNCGSGSAVLESDLRYDDGLWHTVEFSRNQTDGKLFVDRSLVGEGRSSGHARALNISPPYYLGGVPHNMTAELAADVRSVVHQRPFVGCLRNVLMNGKPMENPRTDSVVPCSENVESGVFFGSRGGYMKLQDKFKVGMEIDIQMDIKPRNASGLLMSVHGKKDYLVLQMVDGVIRFTVDNGKGPIEAAYKPSTKHHLCDGNWHSVQAIKSKNVVSLSVDKIHADAGIGQSQFTDTRGALFLGGHQLVRRMKGFVSSRNFFNGCIRNVHINNTPINMTYKMASGGVMVGVCPTN